MKTIEEMLEYARNIADNDENANIVFLFYDRSQLIDITQNHITNVYKSLGKIQFGIIPEDSEVASQQWSGTHITHLFFADMPRLDVYVVLKRRIRSHTPTKEPLGIYTRFYVERWLDY